MSFICQNITCSIAIIKANIPDPGNCPVCQQPLVELTQSPLLSDQDEKLITSLPYVIAYPLKQTLLEKHAWTRINLFKDTFLNYLKYLGLLSASEFFNSNIKDRGMVSLFHQNLTETAFGKWNHYIRETLKFLKEKEHQFFCTELMSYYEQVESGKKVKQYKGEIEFIDANGDVQLKKQETTAIGILINFRNRYLGHGLTLDTDSSEKLWNEYFPIFRSLLEQLSFAQDYPMYKKEHGEIYLLQSAEIEPIDIPHSADSNIWIQRASGKTLNILPFFIVPGEVALTKEDKAQVFTYESYTGKTIKFFSPEGIEKQTSGKILDRLNLLLRDKQKEIPFTPDTFSKDVFLKRIEEENKLLIDTLISEKKIIPGVYQHREQMEIKLREWIGARANIFFIAAEAGSGKTNLLVEIQRQYTERGYPGLLIRAGRMEKISLKEQVTYLLNIDAYERLDKYTAIAGTKSDPTFILIDGLNEANNAEAIWQEIVEWSKIIEPGSIKFVVTSRANTKSDLERYKIDETNLNFLYGENKDHEKGLGAYAFWLTPLDMNEMKGAWENYTAKDKSRYKPLFSFDDIATFDRAIYNQINNPLVLRLFLEIYNGKNLPKKGGKHLHIWQDWFKTFSQEEQTFLKLLANEVWIKGENELLLDDLLNKEKLRPYLTSDLVNSPYTRMKNMGWVSRYVKDMNGCLSFTVEGALLYLLGVKLQEHKSSIDFTFIQNTLSTGTKLQQSAVESYLCEQSLAGDLNLVTVLIDMGVEQLDLCIRPLLYFLKAYGVEEIINKILVEPTENDWKVLKLLNEKMEELQANSIQNSFTNSLLEFSKKNNLQINIGLLISLLPTAKVEFKNEFISKIENTKLSNGELEDLAFYLTFNGFPKKAISIYESLFDYSLISNPTTLNKIATAYHLKEDKEKAKSLYLKAMDFALRDSKKFNRLLAMIYYNLATVDDTNNYSSIEYLQNSLKIELQLYGELHENIVKTYIWLAKLYDKSNDKESKNVIINKVIKIHQAGIDNFHTNTSLGGYYYFKEDYKKALEYYKIAFKIQLEKFGDHNYEILQSLLNLSYCNRQLENYEDELSNLLIAKNVIDKNEIYSNERFIIMISLANLYYYFDNRQDAIIHFENVFELIENKKIIGINLNDDFFYESFYSYAVTLYYNNQYQDSIKIIEKLPDEHKSNKKILELLANNYYCMEEYNHSIYYYNKALLKIDNEFEKISIYIYVAGSYQSLLDYDSAINIYIKIIDIAEREKLTEELITAYFRKGFCYYELKNNLSAIDSFNLGFKISSRPYFLDRLAQCYESENNKNLALQYYIEYAEKVRLEENSDNKDDIESAIQNAFRLAKDLEKMNELPDWIKDYSKSGESE
jgi:tetratricopeptide (TPR) repeat protein